MLTHKFGFPENLTKQEHEDNGWILDGEPMQPDHPIMLISKTQPPSGLMALWQHICDQSQLAPN
jgi:hypothetical protein